MKATETSSTYYTHGFHPYPAKYPPQLVNKYINKFCKTGETLIDPFCGSGTTIVEGVLNGINSIGIDLNPIACIISKAKSNKYISTDIRLLYDIINEINAPTENKYDNIEIPDFPNRDHWFQTNICYELAYLKYIINKVQNNNVKDLLNCAFSSIIVKVSNQDSEVRYTAKKKNLPDGTVNKYFIDTLLFYANTLSQKKYQVQGDYQVFHSDTLSKLKQLKENEFDFAMTSPPYINTFDYYLYHKQRMHWLDYDYMPVRKNEIGNHHRIDSMDFTSAKAEYIKQMWEIMNEISRITKPNSYYILVVGDGIVDGNTIDMSQVFSEICSHSSFQIQNIESKNLSEITRSFNKKFSKASKKEHIIEMINKK